MPTSILALDHTSLSIVKYLLAKHKKTMSDGILKKILVDPGGLLGDFQQLLIMSEMAIASLSRIPEGRVYVLHHPNEDDEQQTGVI